MKMAIAFWIELSAPTMDALPAGDWTASRLCGNISDGDNLIDEPDYNERI